MSNDAPRSTLDEMLCTALAVGLVLVAILPAARGMSAIGWMPLWLIGMPAVAWWAVRGFPLPCGLEAEASHAAAARAGRRSPQARRSRRIARRAALRQAA